MSRRLIINADDFGLTAGVNRAIAQAHRSGLVTSATLMSSAQAFDDAVQIARATPNLSVGCHVVLLDGESALPANRIPSLLNSPGGKLRAGLLQFAVALTRGRLRHNEVRDEVAAQIKKAQAAGINVSHVDTHKHTHLFPAILKPLLEAARECGVRALRNPFVPSKPLAFAHLARRPRLWARYTEVRVLRGFAQSFARAVAAADMRAPDGSLGVVVTGALDERLFDAIIGCMPEGTWELVCHPGYSDLDLDAVRTRLRKSRETELRVLTSERARESLRKHGIELISYFDFNQRPSSTHAISAPDKASASR